MRRAVLLLALLLLAAPAVADADEGTHPRVEPGRGGPRTTFRLRFTLTEQPGHRGFLDTRYVLTVAPPNDRSACRSPQPPAVVTGRRGTATSVRLPRPRRGWCPGRHRVTVLLVRGPYCEQSRPCPEFPTRAVVVGRATFVVRAQRP